LLLRFPALVHMVVELNIGLAAATDENVTQSDITIDDSCRKAARWTLNIEFKPVYGNHENRFP